MVRGNSKDSYFAWRYLIFWHSVKNQLIIYAICGSVLESQFVFINLYVNVYTNQVLIIVALY